MKPVITNYWKWKGKEYRFDIYTIDSFSTLENIKQVYGFVLNEDRTKTIIVKRNNGMYLLPGGGVEEGEKPEETLIREIKKESNRDIKIETAKPLYYQKMYLKDEQGEYIEQPGLQVRYSVIVKNDNEFIHDPDNGDIVEAFWVDIKDIDKYLDWGDTAILIKNLLLNE